MVLTTLVFTILSLSTRYQAVVVDNHSRQPLAGVTVLDPATQALTQSDAQGRVTLPQRPQRLRLSFVGYKSCEVQPRLRQPLDTLALEAEPVGLAEVVVKPASSVWLTSYAAGTKLRHGFQLPPATQVAVRFQPAAGQTVDQVEQVDVPLTERPVQEGRLRVRLVAADPDGPGTHDLLPATEYTAAQLTALPDHVLHIPVAHPLALPAEGLYVVVESLPGKASEVLEALQLVTPAKGPRYLAAFLADPGLPTGHRYVSVEQYAQLLTAAGAPEARTYTRGKDTGWQLMQNRKNPALPTNSAIALRVLAR